MAQIDKLADYVVVEAVCEECGVVNDHFTALCPYRIVPPVEPEPLHVALPLRGAMEQFVGARWIPAR